MKPVRRTQAISPFGVGAMVDFPGPTSLVHAGLDAWPVDPSRPESHEFRIDDEPRLARRLNVDFFMLPPDYRKRERGVSDINLGLTIPFLRFPLWHACPYCGRMYKARHHDAGAPVCEGPVAGGGADGGRSHKKRKTVQVRFVAACAHGHMQDFPWVEWLRLDDLEWRPEGPDRWLRLRSTGSAGAEGIEIVAEERAGSEIRVRGRRTLAGAVGGEPGKGDSPLAGIGIRCTGQNPALARGAEADHGCGEQLYVLLRGASNLYYSDVVSSIYVPDIEDASIPDEVLNLLEDHALKRQLLLGALDRDGGKVSSRSVRNALNERYPDSRADPEILAEALNRHYLRDLLTDNGKIAAALIQLIKAQGTGKVTSEIVAQILKVARPDWDIDPAELVHQVQDWYEKYSGVAKQDKQEGEYASSDDENNYRAAEYRVFCKDGQEGSPKTNLLIRSAPLAEYGSLVQTAFDRISLLHKLRETRAFRGYNRIFSNGSLTEEERWNLIATRRLSWLPAIIVRGEGIFLKFRKSALADWEARFNDFHIKRLDVLNQQLGELRKRRRQDGFIVTPRYVLLHTFAHLLINELVFECGYGSASLRERIYCSEGSNGMEGVLIYTAAGDSEGTMGGLVRMGQPGLLDGVITRMLEKSTWCSTDPVCIESTGQGPDNCNLAACHACALLPETSCEQQNRLLDRGVVMGTLLYPEAGFFRFLATQSGK